MAIRSAKLIITTIGLVYGSLTSGKAQAANTLLRCDIKFESSFTLPWLPYAQKRNLDIDYANRTIIDKTVNGSYHNFDIVKNDSSWVVARSSKASLIKDYLQFEDSHRPKYAEISINKIDLSIQLIIHTEKHTDPNDAYGNSSYHIGSRVYAGRCDVARRKI